MTKIVKVQNFPRNVKIKSVKTFFDGLKVSFVKMDNHGSGKVEFKTAEDAKKAESLNMTLFKDKSITVRLFEDDKKEKDAKPVKKTFPVKDEANIIEEIMDTGRLYLRYLNYTVKETDLVDLFKKYGDLIEVHLPYDFINKRNKGFAFVTFVSPSEAVKAYKALNHTVLCDRKLHILAAAEKPEDEKKHNQDNDDKTATSFQENRQEALRATASSSHNWNALFVSADTVAEYLANKVGISRAELFSRGESMAVRFAQAETQLVAEIRTFLEESGVCIDRLEALPKPGKRSVTATKVDFALSSTTFLVKNLSPSVTKADLERIFNRFPGMTGILLPRYGATAIVSYHLSQQAKVAYLECAYTLMGDDVLMLQWAPADLMSVTAVVDEKEAIEEGPEAGLETPEDREVTRKLIVKNLSFQATEKELYELFGTFGGLEKVRMSKKDDRGHRGFAFLIFETKEAAKVVKETMGVSTHLLGRKLVLEYSKEE